MRQTNTDKAWEYYGQNDPYWGVVTADNFRQDLLNDNAKQVFFDSGSAHVGNILHKIHTHVDPAFQIRRSLDFGCGVGRILIPLARSSEFAVGIDVSPAMLSETEANCRDLGIDNVSLIQSTDTLDQLAAHRFNFVHSFIVLQHIPPKRGIVMIERLLDMVDVNGIAVLQMTYHDASSLVEQMMVKAFKYVPYLYSVRNLIKKRPMREPLMQMNTYNMNKILQLLQARGFENNWFDFTTHGYFWGVTLICQRSARS